MVVELDNHGIRISKYFEIHNIHTFAIYGFGDMGNWLVDRLHKEEMSPQYGIDSNEAIKYKAFKTISPQKNREKVDLVIVTVTHSLDEISNNIYKYNKEAIISLENMIEELYFKYLLTPIPMRYFRDIFFEDSDVLCDHKTAICYFAYNRPDKVKITLNALGLCDGVEEVPIIIIQDNVEPNRVDDGTIQTRKYIEEFIKNNSQLNIEYIQWKRNAGPFISLTQGLVYAFSKYDRAIRIEEDIEVRRDFLKYMNSAFDFYEDDNRVFGISSYNPNYICERSSTYLSKRACPWGGGFYRRAFMDISWHRELFTIKDIDGYLVGRLFRMIYKGSTDGNSGAEDEGGQKTFYFLASRTAAIRAGIESEEDIEYVDSMKFFGSPEETLRVRFGIEVEDASAVDRTTLILEKAKKQRENYKEYMSKLGISGVEKGEHGGLALFDFVAKGTTQMYLQKLFEDRHLKGFYFLQLEPEFMSDKGLDIEPFYSDSEKNTSAIFDNYYILETMLTSPYPQMLEMDEDGRPVFAEETRSESDIEVFKRAQDGIEQYFKEYIRIVPENARTLNKALDEKLLELVNKVKILDEDFLNIKVEDPFFGRMTDIKDVIG